MLALVTRLRALAGDFIDGDEGGGRWRPGRQARYLRGASSSMVKRTHPSSDSGAFVQQRKAGEISAAPESPAQ